MHWRVLAHAWTTLSWVRLIKRFHQSTLATHVTRGAPPPPQEQARSERRLPVEDLVALFRIAVKYQPGAPSCLCRALALRWLLWRNGYLAVLRVGVRKLTPGFEAHAWVELNDRVIDEEPDIATRFLPLKEIGFVR